MRRPRGRVDAGGDIDTTVEEITVRTAAPIRPATESIPIAPPAHVRRLGLFGLVWALGYVPIHVYWAMGGRSAWIGITDPDPDWRVANWGACVVLLGAGLTCLALTESWGASMPAGLRRGAAWIGGVIGLAAARHTVPERPVAAAGGDRRLRCCGAAAASLRSPASPWWCWA